MAVPTAPGGTLGRPAVGPVVDEHVDALPVRDALGDEFGLGAARGVGEGHVVIVAEDLPEVADRRVASDGQWSGCIRHVGSSGEVAREAGNLSDRIGPCTQLVDRHYFRLNCASTGGDAVSGHGIRSWQPALKPVTMRMPVCPSVPAYGGSR